jgi:hypothetical protein
MKPFTIGFMGTTQNDVLLAAAEHAIGSVFMPFTGSGKDVSWLTPQGHVVISYDTQYLSQCVVDGIFNAREGGSLLLATGEAVPNAEGFATEHYDEDKPLFKRMTRDDCMLVDGIAVNGNLYDKACLANVIIQSTIGGRLTHWERTPEKVEEAFFRSVERQREFFDLEGIRDHTWADAYDHLDRYEFCDTVWIDPPKVVTSTDVYSKMFWRVNGILQQEMVTLPTWKWTDMIPNLRRLWELPCKRLIQFYCSDVRPTDDQVRTQLEKYGTIVERLRFRHGNRADYVYIVDKET